MRTITVITDCRDDNAWMRLTTRLGALIPKAGVVSCCGVDNDLEAAGNLVDALDALAGQSGLILVNVAPRNGQARQWRNGTPFGYFYFRDTLVVTTLGGFVLSFLRKLTGVDLNVQVFDLPEAIRHLGLDPATQARISASQFRSFEFAPRVAAALLRGEAVPATPFDLIPEAPLCIWGVDCFGNGKTNVRPQDVGFEVGKTLALQCGRFHADLACFARLADIPDGSMGVSVGSSGLGHTRWLEIQLQGGRAADMLGLKPGDRLTVGQARHTAAAAGASA